jgi:hypothetical protein
MPKYLMINHGVGAPEHWETYFDLLIGGDHLIGGSSLASGISLKDGRYAAAISESVTGYIVIQADSLEQARDLMIQSPIHQAGGTVELFPLEET